jgi:predicted alpha/beta-fold hydrolase
MTLLEPFNIAWWLDNPHLQSIWPTILRNTPRINFRHERFTLSDGDFVDLSWGPEGRRDTVILLHGLGGSAESSYMRGMMQALAAQGFNTVAMHFRNCSNEANRHYKTFHAGQTCDLSEVIAELKKT